MWEMMVLSLSDNKVLMQSQGVVLWPKGFSLDAYKNLLSHSSIWIALFNSLVVSFVASVGHVLSSALAGYALVQLPFRGKGIITLMILLTLLLPPQVNIVPLFLLMKSAGLLNSYGALIIPALVSGFGVMLFRQWFLSFPSSLKEASTLEGCTPLETFWYVALPTATSPMISLGLLSFIGLWGSFLWPLVAIHNSKLVTLPLFLAQLKQQYRDVLDWPTLMAGAAIAIIPIVIVFLILQKPFFKQVVSGDGSK